MKKKITVIIAILMIMIMCIHALPVSAQEAMPNIKRMSGKSRYETACVIFESARKLENVLDNSSASHTTAIIANSTNFADALVAVPYAQMLGSPILLVSGKGAAEKAVLDTLKKHKTEKVLILGGEGAISRETEQSFIDAGYNTGRLYGKNRYETAAKIATQIYTNHSATNKIFIVSGENFPDALSVGAAAGKIATPVLYSNKKGTIDDATAEYIKNHGIDTAIIVGGGNAVGGNAETELGKMGVETIRIYGKDRYETSIKVYEEYWKNFVTTRVSMATGSDFPDALAGGMYSASRSIPVLLVKNNGDNSALSRSLARNEMEIEEVVVYGGEAVVSTDTVEKVFRDCISFSANNTQTPTNPTAASRWVSQSEMNRILDNVKSYADSIGMHWDTTLDADTATWGGDTRVHTTAYDSASEYESRVKGKISYYYNMNAGYEYVNVIITDKGNGEYTMTCYFG